MTEGKRIPEVVKTINKLSFLIRSELARRWGTPMNATVTHLQEYDMHMFMLHRFLMDDEVDAFCLYFKEKDISIPGLRRCFRESVRTAGSAKHREEATGLYIDMCKQMGDLLSGRRSSM